MEYLIKDFGTKEAPNDPPLLRTVRDGAPHIKSLWGELNNARTNGQKISVYVLPDCVLDWS